MGLCRRPAMRFGCVALALFLIGQASAAGTIEPADRGMVRPTTGNAFLPDIDFTKALSAALLRNNVEFQHSDHPASPVRDDRELSFSWTAQRMNPLDSASRGPRLLPVAAI